MAITDIGIQSFHEPGQLYCFWNSIDQEKQKSEQLKIRDQGKAESEPITPSCGDSIESVNSSRDVSNIHWDQETYDRLHNYAPSPQIPIPSVVPYEWKSSCASSVRKLDHVIRSSLNTEENNFFEREVLYRGSRVFLLATAAFAGITDFALSIVSMVGSLLTLGCIPTLTEYSMHEMKEAGKAVKIAFECLLHMINPHATWDGYVDTPLYLQNLDTYENELRYGLQSDSWSERNIKARLESIHCTTVVLISGIFDFCMGLLASAAALVTLGLSDHLNSFAIERLNPGDHLAILPLATRALTRAPI